MEMVEGMTMKQLLDANNKLPLELCLDITRQVAEALGHAWTEQKLVHRDIKPDNIMIVGDTCVAKLMDLGLSRFANDILAGNEESDEIMGTPQYISPEQLVGSAMDFRGDQYSLGATLYHCLTGEFPFNGRNAADIARKHLQDPLPPPTVHDASIPESVCRLLTKMMAKHPDDRFPDAASLAREIETIKKNLTSSGSQVGKTGSGRIVFTPPRKANAGKASNGPEKEFHATRTTKAEAKANHRPNTSKSTNSNTAASPSRRTGMHPAAQAPHGRGPRPQEQGPNWGLIGMIGMIILGIVIGAIAAMASKG
jgi:serine/threonine protein kinase